MMIEFHKDILFDYFMENSQEIITVKDLNYDYSLCSRTFLKLLNFSHSSRVIGKNMREILPFECYSQLCEHLRQVLFTREPVTCVFSLGRDYGGKILKHTSVPIVQDCEITGIVSISHDITKEEILKQNLVRKINEQKELLEKKKQLEAQKEMFMATLTHDLKNPVQAQLMSLKMLNDGMYGKLSAEQHELLEIIIESSKYMQNMLGSLLNTYKYDNGVIELERTVFSVDTLMKSCLNEVKPLAKSREIRIFYNSDIKEDLSGDIVQLRRVVGNLLNNALNYAFRGTDLVINIYKRADNAVFEFINYGNNIPEDVLEHIFEKYVSGNKLTGVGLGLYFSKKVVDAHGGRIFAENIGENKIKFTFELPVTKTAEKASIQW